MRLNQEQDNTPYGEWDSPISADFVVANSRALAAPRACRRTARAYFTETNGARRTIIQVSGDGTTKEVLPVEVSCQNSVYEYGAGLYDVLPDGRIIFSDQDNGVRILDPDAGYSSALTASPVLRYSSFSANDKTPWVIAIEEDHTNDSPSQIQTNLVAINILTSEVKRIVSGADFYYLPQSNAHGSKVAWLEWNHPDLLFDACKLYTADFHLDGSISNIRFITGANNESVTEPRWGLDGTLFFAQEAEGFRQLFRLDEGSNNPRPIKLAGLDFIELGEVLLFEGSRTFVPLTERYLVASGTSCGTRRLLVIDLEENSWREAIDGDTICHLGWDAIARLDDSTVLVIGAGIHKPQAVHKINIHNPNLNTIIRLSVDDELPEEFISKPLLSAIPSSAFPTHTIYGYLWRPRNPKYRFRDRDSVPMIISAHGGPTGNTGPGLSYRVHYFTSRGFAYFALNYSGSTGHGRNYRNSLWGNWGILDAADAADTANYAVEMGFAKPGAVGITGLSAGGYNTLQCLTRHPKVFAGGVCASGISDLERFDDKTHKLESDYTAALTLPKDASKELRDKIYRERSARYHAEKIEAPLLLLHGTADTVVPLEQARIIADILKERGGDVKIVEFEGDGHMLAKPESAKGWIGEEEKWWKRTLLSKTSEAGR